MGIGALLPHKYLCYLKEVIPVLHILVIKSSYFEFQLKGLFYAKHDTFASLSIY